MATSVNQSSTYAGSYLNAFFYISIRVRIDCLARTGCLAARFLAVQDLFLVLCDLLLRLYPVLDLANFT